MVSSKWFTTRRLRKKRKVAHTFLPTHKLVAASAVTSQVLVPLVVLQLPSLRLDEERRLLASADTKQLQGA